MVILSLVTQARARGSPLWVLVYKDGSCFLMLMYSHFPYCIPQLTVSSLTNALEYTDSSKSTIQYPTDSSQCQVVSEAGKKGTHSSLKEKKKKERKKKGSYYSQVDKSVGIEAGRFHNT